MGHNFTFNHDDKERREYEILEPGWYDFRIKASYDKDPDGADLVAKTGTPYLKFQCEELDSGVILGHFLFLDETQSKKVYYFLVATGNEPSGDEITIDPEMFVDKEFRGKVEVSNGRNRITRANPKPDAQEKTEPFVPKQIEKEVDPDLEEDVPF